MRQLYAPPPDQFSLLNLNSSQLVKDEMNGVRFQMTQQILICSSFSWTKLPPTDDDAQCEIELKNVEIFKVFFKF